MRPLRGPNDSGAIKELIAKNTCIALRRVCGHCDNLDAIAVVRTFSSN